MNGTLQKYMGLTNLDLTALLLALFSDEGPRLGTVDADAWIRHQEVARRALVRAN